MEKLNAYIQLCRQSQYLKNGFIWLPIFFGNKLTDTEALYLTFMSSTSYAINYIKMTAGMGWPGLLTATPQQVAEGNYRVYRQSTNTIYTRWFWRWIMVIIRTIPESFFRRLSL